MRIGRAQPGFANARPEPFEAERSVDEPAFRVDVEGFEGPLDLLLELARRQKVDLARISILQLADQYLAFVEEARKRRLELAADYLVMAAWLAYLKSRQLLPSPPKEAPDDAADLAENLAQRLRRLETIRRAAELMMKRPLLGRDVFARGAPESFDLPAGQDFTATLYDLISAYARQTQKRARTQVRLKPREVWTLTDAREALSRLVGGARDWVSLDRWLLEYGVDPKLRRSARASSFSASLELVREGRLELRQDAHFSPLYMRSVETPDPSLRSRWSKPENSEPEKAMSAVTRLFEAPQSRFTPEDLRVVEALLFAAAEPLPESALAQRLPQGCDVAAALAELQRQYAGRGVQVVRLAGRWMFRTPPDLAWLLGREELASKKLSRSAIETLAIVAYHQR